MTISVLQRFCLLLLCGKRLRRELYIEDIEQCIDVEFQFESWNFDNLDHLTNSNHRDCQSFESYSSVAYMT